ncbi:citryl-CoA lyase [Methanothermobacter marburgensis]|uniref:Predicted citrate synthase n=1 Tax=Methanothermobacter marburgensis (strain ATCC BAA-927 / DSM 2133 / JCM 14651 / NBRC 100331 / OCM 82 / Marburg) TaxID=79929 RepID=D9PXI7_METTM|nr:citryl-CoA lyase [Methanothermobacter marburgensis]ADL58935.1 predicted citrate synthase [Methanothermobacter marburgensis str. Marburg]WBF09476.1 citryl-CoA lyase [Methanothermobacter marburgensis]
MAIGKDSLENVFRMGSPKWRTSITRVEPNRIVTRGYSQEDLIGGVSFSEMVYLLIRGELPPGNVARMLEAVLVSFCDHGVTPPSTQAARMIASAGSPVHACIAGGLLAFGKNHAGAIERSMKLFQETVSGCESEDEIPEAAVRLVDDHLRRNRKVPGFGHRYHNADPRAVRLLDLAEEYDCVGPHTRLAVEVQNILLERKGVRMNVDGANAGILSDMGFDWRTGAGVFMIGRLPGLISHVYEEKVREPAFRKFFDIEEIHYDGEEEKNLSTGADLEPMPE